MDYMLSEIVVIAVMILINGFFSCSEFAIISVRKSLVASLVAEGDSRAAIIEELQKDQHRLLAIIQIGVTVSGSAASTVGGILAIQHLKPFFAALPWQSVSRMAEPLAAVTVVILLSYIMLIIGELVPKALGLQYCDVISLRVARSIKFISDIASVAVTILTLSSKLVLKIIGISGDREAFVSREEIRHIVSEAHETGVFTETENEYIRNVFEFTHTCVREVMVPRTRIVALDLDAPQDEILQTVMDNMYSRYPVYRGDIENLCGILHTKDLLGNLVAGKEFDMASVMRHPAYVPERKKINDLLKEMQRTRNQMALVVDEYGGLSGLVTTEDLIEELVGEIRDEHDAGEAAPIETLPDGSFMADGLLTVFDLAEHLKFKAEENPHYDTVAGLILHELGHFPLPGEEIIWHGLRFICEEVTRTAILKVRIERFEAGEDEEK